MIYTSHADPSNWGPEFGLIPSFLVLHGTGKGPGVSVEDELAYLMSVRKKRFGYHFLITEAGDIHEITPLDRVAWHAGESSWEEDDKVWEGLNYHSWGVGLSSDNRTGPITTQQVNAVIWLRLNKLHVPDNRVLTHKDISYPRKRDPDTMTLDQLDAVRRRLRVYDTLVREDKDIQVDRRPFVFSTVESKLHVRFLGDERI